MFERRHTVYSNDRNNTITVHLTFCSHALHKTDKRGEWFTDLTDDDIRALSKESGFKVKRCSKCGS